MKKVQAWSSFWIAVWVMMFTPAVDAVTVRVTGDHVNLRSASGGQAYVVAQVDRGAVLEVIEGLDGDWVAVQPPAAADVWVYAELVRDGKISATRVQVRGGPDIKHKVVGRAEKGQALTVRGREGDWLRIAPLPGCRLWVSRQYVDPVTPPKPVAPTPPVATPRVVTPPVTPTPRVPAPRPAPVRSVTPVPVRPAPVRPAPVRPVPRPVVPTPAPRAASRPVVVQMAPPALPPQLAAKRLVATREQGRKVEYVGVLRSSGLVWRRPSRYRLVMRDDQGNPLTLCYLLGDENTYGRILGSTLHVTGREYWVQGVKASVLLPEQIIRKN